MTGLTNGTTYRFTVTAENSAGTGPRSAVSNAVTPTAISPATGTQLINENFASSAGGLGRVAGGEWAVSIGRYTLSAPADEGEAVANANLAVHERVIDGDFTLTALASTTPTDSPFNDFSIVFGFQDPSNYYFASFSEGNDANTSGIFKVVNGTRTELADIDTDDRGRRDAFPSGSNGRARRSACIATTCSRRPPTTRRSAAARSGSAAGTTAAPTTTSSFSVRRRRLRSRNGASSAGCGTGSSSCSAAEGSAAALDSIRVPNAGMRFWRCPHGKPSICVLKSSLVSGP